MKRILTLAMLLMALAALMMACAAPSQEQIDAAGTQVAGAATAVGPTVEAVASQVGPTVEAMATEMAPTVEAMATELAPTVAAVATQAGGMIDAAALEAVDPTGATVLFWHQHTGAHGQELAKIVDEFNASNEWGITVTAENAGSYDDIYNKMIAGLTSGELPNLTVAYQNQASTYQSAEALVDLNAYINSPKWGLTEEDKADFFESFVQSDFNAAYGQQLGFPPNRSMEVLYVNTDLLQELGFDAPPATWEEFQEQACAAKDAGKIGYELSIDASRFASMLFSRGGDIMNADQSAYTLDSEESIETFTYLQTLFAEGCAQQVAEDFGDQTDFGAGDLLFGIGSSSGLPFWAGAVADGYGGNWEVAALPHSTPDPVMNIYGASVSIPVTTPEQQLAAWLFVKYYTSAEVQAGWARASNYFPVRESVAEGLTDYFAENPQYEAAFNMLEYGKAEPPVGSYDLVRGLIADAMVQIADGADVTETVTALQEEATQLLEESNQ